EGRLSGRSRRGETPRSSRGEAPRGSSPGAPAEEDPGRRAIAAEKLEREADEVVWPGRDPGQVESLQDHDPGPEQAAVDGQIIARPLDGERVDPDEPDAAPDEGAGCRQREAAASPPIGPEEEPSGPSEPRRTHTGSRDRSARTVEDPRGADECGEGQPVHGRAVREEMARRIDVRPGVRPEGQAPDAPRVPAVGRVHRPQLDWWIARIAGHPGSEGPRHIDPSLLHTAIVPDPGHGLA